MCSFNHEHMNVQLKLKKIHSHSVEEDNSQVDYEMLPGLTGCLSLEELLYETPLELEALAGESELIFSFLLVDQTLANLLHKIFGAQWCSSRMVEKDPFFS